MFNLDKFIADSVTYRPVSMFKADIEANKETLTRESGGQESGGQELLYTIYSLTFAQTNRVSGLREA